MKENAAGMPDRKKALRQMFRGYLPLGAVVAAAVIILRIFPDRAPAATGTMWAYLREMMMILPALMIIMGLFTVFVSKELVVKYMGQASGIRGIAIAMFFGALPTGPLYLAFPLAAALRSKGASIANIIVFLSAWACIKIPQELIELQFLGLRFMAVRLTLTIVFVAIMGILIEKLIAWTDREGIRVPQEAER